jgi:Ankyrin repeats (3 copies)
MKQELINLDFTQSCKNGNINRVRYYLLECSVKAEVNFNDQEGFNEACNKNRLEVVQFLMSYPEWKTQLDISKGFENACYNNHLELVKLLAPLSINLSSGLVHACGKGNLQIVSFILTDSIVQSSASKVDIHYSKDSAIKIAVQQGHLPVVDYLLTSSELKFKAQVDVGYLHDTNMLISACESGHIDIVEYLLISPQFINKLNIHAYEEKALISAVNKKQYEVAKILTSDVLKDPADIYTDKSHIFKQACYDKAYGFVEYLLYKKEMKLSIDILEDIAEKLWHVPNEHQHILNMIDKRDMYLRLNNLSGKAPTKVSKI